jgi:hypothetical protein
MIREATLNPQFGSRKWVKLWVNEWLDGTTRFEMSDAQRAFWTDLLAMAGRSRFPGIICAGQIDGKFVGYPLNKFQALMSEPIDVESTFALFEKNRKVEVEVTQETPTKLYKLTLLNWARYQSEYQRQKPYRQKLRKGDTSSDTESNTTEVEVRSRSEKRTKTLQPASEPQGFLLFVENYPQDHLGVKSEAMFAWMQIPSAEMHLGEILSGLEKWKASERWADEGGRFIPNAARFLKAKGWQSNPPNSTGVKKKNGHDYSATFSPKRRVDC